MDGSIRLLSIFLLLTAFTVGMAEVYVQFHGAHENPKMVDEYRQMKKGQRKPASMESLRAEHNPDIYLPKGKKWPPPERRLIDPDTGAKIFVYGRCVTPNGEIFYPLDRQYQDCIDNNPPYQAGNGPFSSKAIGIGIIVSD